MNTPVILTTTEAARITVPKSIEGNSYEVGLNGYPLVMGQNQQYLDALSEANTAPIMAPSTLNERQLRAIYDSAKGIFLPGGYDINPAIYGEEIIDGMTDPSEISEERDQAERLLIEWANADKKPILTVCRGFQLLNAAMGGTLYQDLDSQFKVPLEFGHINHRRSSQVMKQEGHTDDLAHDLVLVEDSMLAAILGTNRVATNSRHHQGVRNVGSGLRAVGHAPDGLVEAIESTDGSRFTIGVQSHPESLVTSVSTNPEVIEAADAWRKLFGAFAIAASDY